MRPVTKGWRSSAFRAPKELIEAIQEVARRDQRSMNVWMVRALQQAVQSAQPQETNEHRTP